MTPAYTARVEAAHRRGGTQGHDIRCLTDRVLERCRLRLASKVDRNRAGFGDYSTIREREAIVWLERRQAGEVGK